MQKTAVFKVFLALVFAVIAGHWTTSDTTLLGVPFIQLYALVGKLFLNALTLVVVPLVCASTITGIARIGSDAAFKSLGIKTFGYFIGTTFLSILIGYAFMTILGPSMTAENLNSPLPPETSHVQALQNSTQEDGFQKIEQLLLRLVPTNILAVAAQGQMLGLISFCMLFGFFTAKIDQRLSTIIIAFFEGVFQIMMKMTQWMMKALPIGAFALVAKVVASTGLESVAALASFFGIVLLSLIISGLVIFPLLLRIFTKVDPISHIKAMAPALLTAFSTSSSAATMPVTIDCLEKRANVSSRISGFTIPLGTSINMPGTALYVSCAVFFIAQASGISLSWTTQALTLLMILLTSFGIAGVPSASLFAVITVLSMVGLPEEGIALILAVERLIDMCRTTVNVFGNSCCAVLIESAEKRHQNKLMPLSENL